MRLAADSSWPHYSNTSEKVDEHDRLIPTPPSSDPGSVSYTSQYGSHDACNTTASKVTSAHNPSGHLQRKNGTTDFETIMHIIKGNIGTGILAMPSAFSKAGILVGTVTLAVIGAICTHCMHMLVTCTHDLCQRTNRTHMSYCETAEACFQVNSPRLSKYSRLIRGAVNFFLIMTTFGSCCVYVLFMAQNIQFVVMKLTNNTGPGCDLTKPMPVRLYEVCLLGVLIPFCFIKNIRVLSPFSVVANVASIIALGVILYDILIQEGLKSITRLPLIKDWSTIPIYFGTVMYAFEAIGVILPLENRMETPKSLPRLFGVLDVGMVTVVCLYITVGFYGYIEYNDSAQGSITLNMNSWYGIVVQLLATLYIFVSYGLQFYVIMTTIGDYLTSTRLARLIGPTLFDYILRAFIVILSFGIAVSADRYLNLLISLEGSFASPALALIIPALLDTVNRWPNKASSRFFWLTFSKNAFIMLLGLVGFVLGTVISLQQLIQELSGHGTDTNACPSS